jgi:hypothetical protein
MEETLLYLISGFLIVGSGWFMMAAFSTYRKALENHEKIEWVLEQLRRALKQIESDDEDEILAGLQVLTALKHTGIRFKALPRLSELAQSRNPNISQYATIAINKFISSPDESSPLDADCDE